MGIRRFDECDTVMDDCTNQTEVSAESNPSKKLERRRKIEDLFEEKRLRDELAEFA